MVQTSMTNTKPFVSWLSEPRVRHRCLYDLGLDQPKDSVVYQPSRPQVGIQAILPGCEIIRFRSVCFVGFELKHFGFLSTVFWFAMLGAFTTKVNFWRRKKEIFD